MEPTLMVIGLNHRTAPLAMRERFFLSENRRYEVLRQLKMAEGVEEIVVLSTCCRTEFLIWASEPTLAANSVLQFLGSEHGLKLTEWQHFYRLLDESALTHVFRVASSLDSLVLGEPTIVRHVREAWEQARTVRASGAYLNLILETALRVSHRVRTETTLGKLAISIPKAACDLAAEVFGSLRGRRILLMGSGELGESAVQRMMEHGAESLFVIDQSPARSREIADKLHGTAGTFADRWNAMLRADIVVSASGCPHVILTREEAERIAAERNRVALVILDIGMPRDVDPDVRRVDGILLYDIEGIERTLQSDSRHSVVAAAAADKIVREEVRAFRDKLQAQRFIPTTVALRHRLEEICRQELESFIEERGPFTREQDQSLHAITAQVIQKIATSLARELKELPEKEEQERMTAAVTRLFHLESPKTAPAGTNSEKENNERKQQRAVAINY